MISQTVPLPPCLRKRLVFGDREQIDALRQMEYDIEVQEKRTKDKLDGVLKKYAVTISYSGDNYDSVWATSKKEAMSIAKGDFCDPDNWEIDHVSASEIKQGATA